MAKHQKSGKFNLPMCMAAALFCLTLISLHLTSGLYAKYVSTASGDDSARVVTFGDLTLTETGSFYDGSKLMIIPGVNLQKKAVVDFEGSEVATYIFVEITPVKWVTSDQKNFSLIVNEKTAMQWAVADGWDYLKTVDGTHVYYCKLNPNDNAFHADIIADNGTITVSDQITKTDLQSMTGISIKLRATVVQLGGFSGPGDAWNSVSAQ